MTKRKLPRKRTLSVVAATIVVAALLSSNSSVRQYAVRWLEQIILQTDE